MKKLGWWLQLSGPCIVAPLVLAACGEDVSNQPVTGGQTLDYAYYEANVNPIFDANIGGRTCSASGCHNVNGGSGGGFKIYPSAIAGSSQMLANFYSAKSFANLNNPPQSKLLLEPLADTAGGQGIAGSHTGGDIFPDSFDPNYQTILTWISNPVTL